MSETENTSKTDVIKRLIEHCHTYKGADTRRSILQLATTAALFLVAMTLTILVFHHHIYWLFALLVLPAAGLLIRLFIIQHDCGHGSFFRSKRANDITGRILSLLTFTPYDLWRKTHNMHHAGSGNLNRRGVGSIDTLTVKEYEALTPRQRFAYRFYRNPWVLLVLGPPLYILLFQRFPPPQKMPYLKEHQTVPRREAWMSVMPLNVAILIFYGLGALILGWQAILAYMAVVLVGFWIGQWLFFVQHQFEDTYWEYNDNWKFSEAAVAGSSYLALPKILQWFTGNIGFHHIHHLCASIPNYRLPECFETSKELWEARKLTFLDSLKSARMALWDEANSRMISFREWKDRSSPSAQTST